MPAASSRPAPASQASASAASRVIRSEKPEPCEHPVSRLPPRWRGTGFEQAAQPHNQGRHHPPRLIAEKLHRHSERRCITNLEAVDQPLETPSGRFASRRLPVFEKSGEIRVYLRFR